MDLSLPIRRRRQHTSEFKQRLIALCLPGISISGVALAHGVNANLLRRWIKDFSVPDLLPAIPTPVPLIPIQVDLPPANPADEVIAITIQKNNASIDIRWPGSQAKAFGHLLKDLLE
jgi:transposase-like protein